MNRPYSMRAARFITSEPSFRPHLSQSQREGMGTVHPMPSTSRRGLSPVAEAIIASLLVVFAIVAGLVL
jgi:hypothetical protein